MDNCCFSLRIITGAFYENFIQFQNLIDLAYIEILTGKKMLPTSVSDFANLEYVRIFSKLCTFSFFLFWRIYF